MSELPQPAAREPAASGPGDLAAAEKLFPLVYGELRDMARRQMRRERGGHILRPTALVNEVYLKLARRRLECRGRTTFLAIACRAMKQVLVDYARREHAGKRGWGRGRVALDEVTGVVEGFTVGFPHIIEALSALAAIDERAARVVELRALGGLANAEAAEALDVSVPTVERDWRFAKAWLRRRLLETCG